MKEYTNEELERALGRFIDYVKIDTQADAESETIPSAEKELDLSKKLMEDLKALGIDSELDEYGIVYGKLPGKAGLDPIGLNAHVDTALECPDKDVKPQRIRNYDGKVIHLNKEFSMSPKEFPSLGEHIGDDLIVTSGDTLLGADDKAGLAIIMGVLDYYVSHPEVEHHPICFCFTVDEEIGRGPDHFDAKKFGAKYAYTIDGGIYDEIAMENFNAAHAVVKIQGISIHPGEAKDKMVNASSVAMAFDRALPIGKRPEKTSGREGFNHCTSIVGETDHAELHYIIRNHDKKLLEEQKEDFLKAKKEAERLYPGAVITVEIKDDYRNMVEVFEKHPEAIDKAKKAYEALGIDLKFVPIRGGTDGATFSFKGCPTPNLGTGSYNHHGRFEYLSLKEFKKMIEIVLEITKA